MQGKVELEVVAVAADKDTLIRGHKENHSGEGSHTEEIIEESRLRKMRMMKIQSGLILILLRRLEVSLEELSLMKTR